MQKILLLYFFSGCVSTSAGIKSSEKIFDSSRAALFWTFVYQVLLGAGCFEVQCDVRECAKQSTKLKPAAQEWKRSRFALGPGVRSFLKGVGKDVIAQNQKIRKLGKYYNNKSSWYMFFFG